VNRHFFGKRVWMFFMCKGLSRFENLSRKNKSQRAVFVFYLPPLSTDLAIIQLF